MNVSLFCFFFVRNFSIKKCLRCLFQNSSKLKKSPIARNLTLVIMETGTHPGFLQILSPVSRCHDEPSRNSSSRLERGSFMRVEPEERVSFATHRGFLCLNEQQRVRVASSEHLPLFPIDRTNERRKSELDSKIRVAFASQIRLDKINK